MNTKSLFEFYQKTCQSFEKPRRSAVQRNHTTPYKSDGVLLLLLLEALLLLCEIVMTIRIVATQNRDALSIVYVITVRGCDDESRILYHCCQRKAID